MTKKDRLKIYENFFHKINMACLVMDTSKVARAVALIDSWSYAHRIGNGEPGPRQQQAIVDRVVKRMDEF